MPKRAGKKTGVEDYRHDSARRPNNPPVGLAWQDTGRVAKQRYEYDPHLDPQLVWAGKAEHREFEVEAPSIHVHERLSTEAILRAVRKQPPELHLFEDYELEPSKQIEFYEHEMGWVNRLILGDSLVVMASLLEKERLGGQVQMIYVDPPYGINYNSNFQARISDPRAREGVDASVTREPEQVRAFRDTWQLGIHSYLAYLRDRLVIGRELLTQSGSIFVQIGDDNVHHAAEVLDEVFGASNRIATIGVQKSGASSAVHLPCVLDFILWYAKDKPQLRYRPLHEPFDLRDLDTKNYRWVELRDGRRRELTREEKANPASIDADLRPYQLVTITSQDPSPTRSGPHVFQDREFWPDKERGRKRHWSVDSAGLDRLAALDRLEALGNTLRVRRYLDDFPIRLLRNVWLDTGRSGFGERQRFVVQTNAKIVERCVLLATDPGDLVLDPTCGSGTTGWVAEKHGRRWVTIDTSRVAVSLARERLLTAKYDYFELLDRERGVDAGFVYDTVRHVRPSDLAYDREAPEVSMRNQPRVDRGRIRVSGPFTVEALSQYTVNPADAGAEPQAVDPAARNDAGEHVATLLDALRKQGIPRHGGVPIPIDSLDFTAGAGGVQAEGTFRSTAGEVRCFGISLGPRFGPITVRQIDDVLGGGEAYGFDLILFAGFACDPEAQKMLAKGRLGRFDVALLEANPDLLVADLLKTTKSSQTFRLFSAPDIEIRAAGPNEYTVEVRGVDSFDAATGAVDSRERGEIAAWFLDQDYDGIVFHVNQAFFPVSDGWKQLERALKAQVDADLMERLRSYASVPFEAGQHRRIAIRVVDDAGTTSETVAELPAAQGG